jgi:hypothetical protein
MLDRGRWWLVPCLAAPIALALPAQKKPAPPKPRHATLQVVDYEDADRIPLAVERVVVDRVPEALVPGSRRCVVHEERLEIDVNGDGEIDVVVHANRPRVVGFVDGGTRRPILFYSKLRTWYAAPGAGLRGTIEGVPLELLDADLDGDFAGAVDYVRWGDGAFARRHESRLLAGDHELWSYTLRRDGNRWQFDATLDPRPAEANDPQWEALMTANRFRRRIGLPALRLDLERCAACRKHADYLVQNPEIYSAAWNGVGPHDEDPERPGFSLEGQKAARGSSITTETNPAAAVEIDTTTMLHRVGYLCAASDGFGVGWVVAGDPVDRKGYSVTWTGWESTKDTGLPIVVPGVGQRRVPTTCTPEIPPVENPADFYSKPRGYPISVTIAELPLKKLSIQLFADAGATPVRGACFTPDAPIHSTRPQNARTAFFVADEPLRRSHRYVAVFDAIDGEKPVHLVWGFATE